MTEFSGGCLCGDVRYEVSGEIARMVNCHCDDCRRNTGAAFATNIFVKMDDLRVTQGKTATYDYTADSGNARVKEFCPRCGSQLFSYSVGRDLTSVKVGTIDDAGFVKPQINLYCARALDYTRSQITDETKNFDGMPS